MSVTPDLVRQLLDYDPSTGIFVWRPRGREHFKSDRSWKTWNTRYANKRAGRVWTNTKAGYQCREIAIHRRLYGEHRLAWMWMTDDPLPEQIDHKNRDGRDNRWDNLRASSSAENGRNQSRHRTNTSGFVGVAWDKRAGRWQSRCMVNGKVKHLGYFDAVDDAAKASIEFRAANGFDPLHGSEPTWY